MWTCHSHACFASFLSPFGWHLDQLWRECSVCTEQLSLTSIIIVVGRHLVIMVILMVILMLIFMLILMLTFTITMVIWKRRHRERLSQHYHHISEVTQTANTHAVTAINDVQNNFTIIMHSWPSPRMLKVAAWALKASMNVSPPGHWNQASEKVSEWVNKQCKWWSKISSQFDYSGSTSSNWVKSKMVMIFHFCWVLVLNYNTSQGIDHTKSTLERVSNPVYCCINGVLLGLRHKSAMNIILGSKS